MGEENDYGAVYCVVMGPGWPLMQVTGPKFVSGREFAWRMPTKNFEGSENEKDMGGQPLAGLCSPNKKLERNR